MFPSRRGVNQEADSYRGQDLSGRDFSHTDIRGLDFSDATLIGTDFSHAIAGLRQSWTRGVLLISILLSVFAGFTIAYAGGLIGILPHIGGMFVILVLIVFVLVTTSQGLGAALAFSAIVMFIITITTAAIAWDEQTAIIPLIGAFAIGGVIAGFSTLASGIALSKVIVHEKAIVWLIITTLTGAILGALFSSPPTVSSWIVTLLVVTMSIPLGVYVGQQATIGNNKFELIRVFAVEIASRNGTSFKGANLTNADFTGALIQTTDFRKANLKHISWYKATGLDYARVEGTYLEDNAVRDLLISRIGQGKSYRYKNLRGLNLSHTNLTEADLIGADLSEVNLQNANLNRAKLVQAQLYGATLSHATLTGAVIQDWAISTDTNFDKIKCDFVYMKNPTDEDPDPWRKPDNRDEIFKDGDFSDFIAPVIKTLDLYQKQNVDPRQVANAFKTLDLFHYQGINPGAAAITLKQLADEHPEANLEVTALEGRAHDKVRVQAVVSEKVNRSNLSAEYSKKYREISSLPPNKIEALVAALSEKDERIRALENIVTSAIQSNRFYVETYYEMGDKVGGDKVGGDKVGGDKIEVGDISESSEVAIGKNIQQ